jgi:23S rRNA pseudouridine2605 synthase
MTERVQKILSQWGIASRREAEQMIMAGRVRLNGTIATLGQKASLQSDRLEVDGVLIQPNQRPQLIYLLLNKPAGVVSTCYDPQNRQTVVDLLSAELKQGQGIHPVGRLDTDSTGALLLTNDGELTFHLTHPRHEIAKTYHVWVEGKLSTPTLQHWRQGVMLDGCMTLPADVEVLKRQADRQTLLQIILREGRNRQIRRVAEQLGHPVKQLHRIAIGTIQLSTPPITPVGAYRALSVDEIEQLKRQVSLASGEVSTGCVECS